MIRVPKWLPAVTLLAPMLAAHAQAIDPLPPETRLVAVSGAPAPTEETFSISAAQDLVVTLTDLQVPAELSTATVVVTQADALIGSATLTSPATSASFPIAGANGPYTLRVFGSPNSGFSVGTFTVCVAPKSSPANCIQDASLAGNITAAGSAADPTISTISATLTVSSAGSYTVSFTDDNFPVTLAVAPNLALFQGSQPIALAIQSGASFTLSPGTYTLLGIAQANAQTQAGLYSVTIAGPSGVAPVLSATYPVGVLPPVLQVTNPVAQPLSVQVTDFGFPTPLASAAAVLVSGGTVLANASLSASVGASATAAPAGILQLWSFGTAGSGAGTYEVDVTSSSANLLQTAAAVNQGTSLAFAFVTPVLAAGSYQASAVDFQFPSVLPTLQFAVAQSGTILQQAATASSVNFTSSGVSAVLLAAAVAPAGGNGLFDLNVQSSGSSPQLAFDKTVAVSLTDLFDTQTINIGVSGNFQVTLTDLKFPSPFQDLDLVVSSGGVVLGKIIGGGSFPVAITPGTFQLTFIATPAAQQQYGIYSLAIVPAAPTVTLTASPTTVASGAISTLTWTTTNATSCTGSGTGFTGDQATGSGSLAVSVTATTTFMLTCTGDGGTASQSVTVTATAAPSKSGGGSLDMATLAVLALLLAMTTSAAIKRNSRCAS